MASFLSVLKFKYTAQKEIADLSAKIPDLSTKLPDFSTKIPELSKQVAAYLPFQRSKFDPATEIPDLSGKVILVTGGSNGLGKESIFQLVQHNPAKVYLAARNQSKAQDAILEIRKAVPNANIVFLEMDLASFASIKKAADNFLASSDRLDILMNNAGIMATPDGLTKDGYEIQFGTNHMGHALLTKLLLPILQKTVGKSQNGDVRIINLSSGAYVWGPAAGIILSQVKLENPPDLSTWQRYGQSKLANVYFSQQLAMRYPSITSLAVHPGGVNTGITDGVKKSYQSYPFISSLVSAYSSVLTIAVQEGVWNQLWAATTPDVRSLKNGGFYCPVAKEFQGLPRLQDTSKAVELWEWTEKELRKNGY